MKVLLDTNVLIAAFISHGLVCDLFQHCLTHHRIGTSDFILGELQKNLKEKFNLSPGRIREILAWIRKNSQVVDVPREDVPDVCRDSSDNRILAAARSFQADCLITGDKDLLILNEFQGIRIVSPAAFWRREGI